METIEQLKVKKQNAELNLRRIKDAIDKIEQVDIVPKLKEKYEGKYFKYENRYDSSESWWMYFYVSSIKSTRYAEGIEYQKTCNGEITVKKEKDMCLSLLETECTKTEFDKNIQSTINLLKRYIL